MDKLNAKGALITAGGIFFLFGAIELYGVFAVGDTSILIPTVICQLIALTIFVAPMIYGMVYASEDDE